MISWHFVESPEDGEIWLNNPTQTQAYIDYESKPDADGKLRRVMVVTKSYLDRHLSNVKHGKSGPLWVGLPSMLVVPDASGEDLRRIVDAVIQQPGVDLFSVILNED